MLITVEGDICEFRMEIHVNGSNFGRLQSHVRILNLASLFSKEAVPLSIFRGHRPCRTQQSQRYLKKKPIDR